MVKMQKLGEYIRLTLAEPEPSFEWVHQLRKPKLSAVTGKLVYKTIEIGPTGNKEKKEVPDLDFVGQPICLGDLDTLEETGVDAAHCPICKAALADPDAFSKPDRKFAVHVFRYACKGNTPQPDGSGNVSVLVWRLSEKRYAKVVSVLEEFAQNGDPMSVDLVLGPCDNVGFQNYNIEGGKLCFLNQDPKDRERATRQFETNNAGDLAPYCGRKADPRYLKSDIEEIQAKWAQANSGGAPVEEPDFEGTLADSGSALLESSTPAKEEAPAAPLTELDDTVGASTEETPPAKEQVPATSGAPAKEKFSFESLMDGLT
jgi:hypothetical protein